MFLSSEEEMKKKGLLVLILSVIFMNEGTISEASLWHTLAKFGVHRTGGDHEVFGNVDKLINIEFVKHNYLEREKDKVAGHGEGGPTYQYRYGARSCREVSKRRILEFVSEVYGVDSIKDWKIQFEQVQQEEIQPQPNDSMVVD